MKKIVKYLLIIFMVFVSISEIKALKLSQSEYEELNLKRAYVVGEYIFDLSKHNPTLKDLMLAAQSSPAGDVSIIEIKIAENLDGELTKEYRELLSSKTLEVFPSLNVKYIYMSEIMPETPEKEIKIELEKKKLTYTATFKANGGTGQDITKSCEVEDGETSCEVTLPNNSFTYSGWTFSGWGTSSSATSVTTAGTNVNLTANKTYYAIWNKDAVYTIKKTKVDNFSLDVRLSVYANGNQVEFKNITYNGVIICTSANPAVNADDIASITKFTVTLSDGSIVTAMVE